MKIVTTNEHQLDIELSGTGSLIFGGVLTLGGVVAAIIGVVTANWTLAAIVGGVMVIGGGTTLFTTNTHISLVNNGTSHITRKRIIGGKPQNAAFESNQVAAVKLQTSTQINQSTDPNDTNGPTQTRVSTVYIVLNDNTEIEIFSGSGGVGSQITAGNIPLVVKAPYSAEAKQIADFFQVPLQAKDLDQLSIQNIGSVAQQIAKGIASGAAEANNLERPVVDPTPSNEPYQPPQSLVQPKQPVADPVTPTTVPVNPTSIAVPASYASTSPTSPSNQPSPAVSTPEPGNPEINQPTTNQPPTPPTYQ